MKIGVPILVGVLAVGLPASARAQQAPAPAPTPAGVHVAGEMQFRYVVNHARTGGTPLLDQDEAGFQLRRVRLVFTGSFISPRLTFRVRPNYDRTVGTLAIDDAWVAYALAHGWKVQVGQFKPQFLREELVSGYQQLTAERSYANDYFTVDYSQGVELTRAGRRVHASMTLHDGSYGANTDFNTDRTTFAVSGRVEILGAGDWAQFADDEGWSEHGRGLMVALAADYEHGETDTTRAVPNVFKLAADVAAKVRGGSLAAAWYHQRFTTDSLTGLPTNLRAARQSALVVQGGAFPLRDRLELFARYEHVDFDGLYYRNGNGVEAAQNGSRNLTSSTLNTVTVGANWFFHQHAAKLTTDIIVASDPVPVTNTAGGLLRTDGDRQLVVRSQVQFRF